MKRNLSHALILVIFFFVFAASAAATGKQFVAAPSYPVGLYPGPLAVGDLNNDGIQDLVIVNHDGSVSVLLGRKDGSFAPARTRSLTPQATALALGDIDGDGNLDVVLGFDNGEVEEVEVFRGNGNGTFKPGVVIDQSSCPVALAVTDLNNDHKNDIVVANSGNCGSYLRVLLNSGHGQFQGTSYPLLNTASALAVSDLNNDGNMDVAVTSSAGEFVAVLLGKGDGTLQPFVNYAAGDSPISLAIGDVNHDGAADLVMGSRNNGVEGLEVLLNKGNGTFGQPVFTAVAVSQSVQLADFDGDGNLDVAGFGGLNSENYVAILLGKGNGAFKLPSAIYGQPQAQSGGMVVGDFNRDKRPDLALANFGSNSVSILFGKGDGTLLAANSYPVHDNPFLFATADFNGDHIPDLVVPVAGTLYTYLGTGNGTFRSLRTSRVNPLANSVAVADFNGDAIEDLVVTAAIQGDSEVDILFGNGDGTFAKAASYPFSHLPKSVAVGDFNGDKKPDIAVAADNALFVMLNNGDGTFGSPSEYAPGYDPSVILVADINKDGKADLIMGSSIGFASSVLLGNGDGTFQNPITLPGGGFAGGVTSGDFNHDGKPDLAALTGGVGGVVIYLGHGDGTFDLGPTYSLPSEAQISSADFNADGKLDLAVTTAGGVELFLGDGAGNFVDAGLYAVGNAPYPIAVADFNGDHRPDLATTDEDGDVVTVLLNTKAK